MARTGYSPSALVDRVEDTYTIAELDIKLQDAGRVSSVAGKTGDISLEASDIQYAADKSSSDQQDFTGDVGTSNYFHGKGLVNTEGNSIIRQNPTGASTDNGTIVGNDQGQTYLYTSGNLFAFTPSGIETIYHTGNRPTTDDIDTYNKATIDSKISSHPGNVTSVAGKTGVVTLDAGDISNVLNTSDTNTQSLTGALSLLHTTGLITTRIGETSGKDLVKYTSGTNMITFGSNNTGIDFVIGATKVDINSFYGSHNKPSASTIGAVPTSRTINGRSLGSNINLSSNDVGAYTKSETDTKIQQAIDAQPEAPVDSVNGETGAVVLSAGDVGAYTKTEVNNKLNDYIRANADDNLTGSLLWSGDQDYDGLYWGERHKDASAHSAAWGYVRQGTGEGQLELGSDDKISIYETDGRVLAIDISTNNKTLDAKGGLLENGTKLEDKYLGKTAKATDADKLDGLQLSPSGEGYKSNCVPYIKTNGILEVGNAIDLHVPSSTTDYDARFVMVSSDWLHLLGSNFHVAGEIRATGNITGYYTSDENLKRNIKEIENPLDKVCSLRASTYEKKNSEGEYLSETGLIAQDVEKVISDLVHENDEGDKTIRTGGYELIALLVGAVKELSAKVDKLEGK